MPFKIRTKLIVAFVALISTILILTSLVGYHNISASDRAVHKVEAIAEEIIVTGDLHRSLEHALMPANDYLITGDTKYIDDFNVSSKRVEEAFKKTDELLGHLEAFGLLYVEEERKTLKDVKTAWLNIKELSLKILSIPNPIGNKDRAMMMEEMDYRWGGPATELIHKWQKGDVEEYKEAVELAEKARRTSWVIMGSAGTLLLILGAGFAVFYSGFFVRPIEKLHHGADAIAGGDFKSRVDVKTGDELEQLANGMNEMAEKLDDFYGTLENQVMERTRELKESEERFRVIAETATDAIVCMRSPGVLTLWNKSAERVFGYAAGEVIGKDLHDIIVPERYRETSREGLKSFFETGTGPVVGKTIEVFGLRKDGSEFSVELSISAMRIRDEWQAAAIIRDITERKKAEVVLAKHVDELERYMKATVQREFRIKELRNRVEELEKRLKG